MRKNLKIDCHLYNCDVAYDTRFRTGQNGMICIGSVSTASNVHMTAINSILKIGSGCSFNRNDILISRCGITIGDKTIMGPNVCIYDHDHLYGKDGKIDGEYQCTPVKIGNNVWVGAGVIILRGTVIGDNCVIGAGCVVSGVIPDNSVVTASNRDLKIEKLHD